MRTTRGGPAEEGESPKKIGGYEIAATNSIGPLRPSAKPENLDKKGGKTLEDNGAPGI